MTEADWGDGHARTLGFLIRGEAGEYHLTATGEPQPDDSFIVMLNAHHAAIEWTLPPVTPGNHWDLVLDTDLDDPMAGGHRVEDGGVYALQARSLVVMVRGNGG